MRLVSFLRHIIQSARTRQASIFIYTHLCYLNFSHSEEVNHFPYKNLPQFVEVLNHCHVFLGTTLCSTFSSQVLFSHLFDPSFPFMLFLLSMFLCPSFHLVFPSHVHLAHTPANVQQCSPVTPA